MVSPILPNRLLTVAEYLEFEAASLERHEYVRGGVYSMSGASRRHYVIGGNIFLRLATAAKGGPCRVFYEGLKLQAVDDVIYYPDAMVLCDESSVDTALVRDPCLVIEVTSPHTARYDRGEKLDVYRRIPSLRAYLIVEQAWRRVERHFRDADGTWQREELTGEGTIPIPCPETTLTLDEIYESLAPLTVRELEAIGYGV